MEGIYELYCTSHLCITGTLFPLCNRIDSFITVDFAGKSISNWEVMEKLKKMAKPDSFLVLRVTKSSLDFLRFEAELEARSIIKVMITRLDTKNIKLSGFTEVLKVRAAEAKLPFPNRHDWDVFFRDTKHMNENNPGERPDTIHVENLPVRWFAIDVEPDKPSEIVVRNVFGTIGVIRNIDIPMLDPYRHESQVTGGNFGKISSLGSNLTFDVYVQFMEYIGFVKAMDTLKGMKIMRNGHDGNAYTAEIKVGHFADNFCRFWCRTLIKNN